MRLSNRGKTWAGVHAAKWKEEVAPSGTSTKSMWTNKWDVRVHSGPWSPPQDQPFWTIADNWIQWEDFENMPYIFTDLL